MGSSGAGGAGNFCAGVLLGATDTGAGAMGAGSCGCGNGCASGFFSGIGSNIDAGSVRGAGKSTCAAGTGVSLRADVAGAAGGCVGWPTAGAAGRTAARSWRWRSATSRWKETCCLEFSSLSWSRFSRSFLYFPSRTRVINGVATWVILGSDVRTTEGRNLAVCFQDHPGSKLRLYKGIKMRYLGL